MSLLCVPPISSSLASLVQFARRKAAELEVFHNPTLSSSKSISGEARGVQPKWDMHGVTTAKLCVIPVCTADDKGGCSGTDGDVPAAKRKKTESMVRSGKCVVI